MVDASEGLVRGTAGRLWFRAVAGGSGRPLLVLHGGPGLPSDYLWVFDRLAVDRPVYYFDQAGCGRSDPLDPDAAISMETFVRDVEAVQHGLSLDGAHLLGHSWGGMLALETALTGRSRWSSVSVSNSPIDMRAFSADVRARQADLPDGLGAALAAPNDGAVASAAVLERATAVWRQRHICRLDTLPPAFAGSLGAQAHDVVRALLGVNEFDVTSPLGAWSVADRLPSLTIPALFVLGAHDQIDQRQAKLAGQAAPRARVDVLDGCSHLPFYERPEAYFEVVRAHLADAEEDE